MLWYEKKTELWPKPDSQCALPGDFPLEVYGAVGFWTEQGPTVCGGFTGGKKCFLYKEHQWVPWTNMGTARAGASALQRHVWHDALIIGGADERGKSLKTNELISSSGSVKTNNFPETIHSHCSFPFNSTHSLVTGGLVELVCQHLVCGLDQYQYHTRTNHENSKRRTWLFHYSNRN